MMIGMGTPNRYSRIPRPMISSLFLLRLSVGKTCVNISDFSAPRGRQTGSKSTDKQSAAVSHRDNLAAEAA
jgi:hypothetical protein